MRRRSPRIVPTDDRPRTGQTPTSNAAKIGRASFSEDLEGNVEVEVQYNLAMTQGLSLAPADGPSIINHSTTHQQPRAVKASRPGLNMLNHPKKRAPLAPGSITAPPGQLSPAKRKTSSMDSIEAVMMQQFHCSSKSGGDEFDSFLNYPASSPLRYGMAAVSPFNCGLEAVKRAELGIQSDARQYLNALVSAANPAGLPQTNKVLEAVSRAGEARGLSVELAAELDSLERDLQELTQAAGDTHEMEQKIRISQQKLQKAKEEEVLAVAAKDACMKELFDEFCVAEGEKDKRKQALDMLQEIEELAYRRRRAEENANAEAQARLAMGELLAEEGRQMALFEHSKAAEEAAEREAEEQRSKEKERRMFAELQRGVDAAATAKALEEAEKLRVLREEAEAKAREEHAAAVKASLEAEKTRHFRMQALNQITSEAEKARKALEEARGIAKERVEAETKLLREKEALRVTQTELDQFEAEVRAQRERRAEALRNLQQEKKHMEEIEQQLRQLAERRTEAQGNLHTVLRDEQAKLDEEREAARQQMHEYQQQWKDQWNQWTESMGIAPKVNYHQSNDTSSYADNQSPMSNYTHSPILRSHHSLFQLLGGDVEDGKGALEGINETDDYDIDVGPIAVQGICEECQNPTDDMLPAHFAAAMGHLKCLRAMANENEAMLSIFDQSRRSPLFYAAANGHGACCSFLIDKTPQCVQLGDQNGDSPLHAAAAAGAVACLRLLLDRGQANVDSRNSMQMVPVHLAKTPECIEVLAGNGTDLNAQDKQRRTPLFVCCAMDRVDCTDLLLELLDSAGLEIQLPDQRGDTPLHAAACNGSQDCLLLLLQFGINPVTPNKKGLRPIDLASRRGHTACERILIEYHLHHTCGQNFDSVLFFATLEGHRSLKAKLDNEGPYEIIKKAPEDQHEKFKRIDSLWSLQRGRSVRLQQFGTWITFEDQNTGQLSWYNTVTGESQFEMPQDIGFMGGGSQVSLLELKRQQSMHIKKLGEWIEYRGTGSKTFYFNEKSGDFQWEKPEGVEDVHYDGFNQNGEADNAEGLETNVEEHYEEEPAPHHVIGDWTAYTDPGTGHIFWYNSRTQQSQWEKPDEEVTEVASLDDLGI